jgi:enoyl-CoA hydratase/carnithine racemase
MAQRKFSSTTATPKFANYQKLFAEHLIMKRKNGIIEVRMHTKGGPLKWCPEAHHMLLEAWNVVGSDPENEVMILTSTEPYWIGEHDHESFKAWDTLDDKDLRYNGLYRPMKSVENLIYGLDIPTIAVIPGPGSVHFNFAVLCDITLCSPDFVIRDDHFRMGMVPGDSQSMLLQGLIGTKRAAYQMYMGENIDARTALELGIVNQVLPKAKLLPRAWEIAENIMKQPRSVRHLTHQLAVRPWKRLLNDDYQIHILSEMYSYALMKSQHNFKVIEAEEKKIAKKAKR